MMLPVLLFVFFVLFVDTAISGFSVYLCVSVSLWQILSL